MAQERIEIRFTAKGDKALILAIKQLDIVTKRLTGTVSVYEKELKDLRRAQQRYTAAGIAGVKNMRIQAGAFATLRSKLLLYSFAVGLGTAALAKLTGKFQEQEKAEKKLSVALGRNIKSLKNYASGLQQVTAFGDEEILNAQALFAAYTDDEEQIKKATVATLDFAAAKGIDLTTASDLMAKTMNSSTNALSRYGINVEGVVGSTSRLDSMTRSISRLYQGQAAAATDTLAGKLTQMTNAFGDANEAVGKAFAPTLKILSEIFTDVAEDTREWFLQFSEDPLETTIRQIEEAGGNADELRLSLLKFKQIDLNKAVENLPDDIKTSEDAMLKLKEIEDSYIAALKEQGEIQEELVEKGIDENDIRNNTSEGLQSQINALQSIVNLSAKGTDEIRDGNSELAIMVANANTMNEQQKIASSVVLKGMVDKYKDMLLANDENIEKIKKQREQYERITQALLKYEAGLMSIEQLQEIINGGTEDTSNTFLDFLDQLDSRLVTTAGKFATTFGDMGDIAANSANERIAANNKAAEEEITALKSSRKFQRMSAEAQLREEQKVRDKLEKQNRKAKKKANKLKAAEFRINQIIKIREAIMNTQTAFSEALGKPWLQALIVAQGAAAVAVIAAQKPPKMERGGYIGGRRHSQGGTLIEAERGEFVMSRDAVESVGLETMNRINQGSGGAINVNFTGNVLSSDFIEEEAIPQIRDAIRRGADIGVG